MSEKRRILVTSALPYANGSIHLGHLLEHIQTDIWTRFQRLRGNECYSVCADDAHGTPVMLKAQELGITPEEMVARTRAEHHQDLVDFHVDYDNYYVTHSPENKALCEEIYTRLDNAGYISKRTINQLFDPEKECSCRIVSLRVPALAVAQKIKTATAVTYVAQRIAQQK